MFGSEEVKLSLRSRWPAVVAQLLANSPVDLVDMGSISPQGDKLAGALWLMQPKLIPGKGYGKGRRMV